MRALRTNLGGSSLSIVNPLERGRAAGKLTLECFGKIELDALFKDNPNLANDVESFLSEMKSLGLKHNYVDHVVKMLGELELEDVEYQLMPWSLFKGNYSLMIDIGTVFPTVKEIKLHRLIFGVRTNKASRDLVSIDIISKEVLRIDDVFWKWEDDWENDVEKLSEATDTYYILKWLINQKGFVLSSEFSIKKYQKISETLEKIINNKQRIEQPENIETGATH